MEIDYVNEFLVLAKVLNYSDAADRLFISQSSLFKHIKALETELGVPLFEKDGKFIVLSKYGMIFLKHAYTLSAVADTCKAEVQQAFSSLEHELGIWSNYRAPDLVYQFHQAHPEVRISWIKGGYRKALIRQAIFNRRQELFFLYESEEYADELVRIPYTTDQLALVVYDGHPLMDRDAVHIGELVSERLVMFPTEADIEGDPLTYLLEEFPFSPHVILTASQSSEILEMVAKKVGVSILLENVVGDFHVKGIRVIPLLPEIQHTVCLCYPKGAKLSPEAKTFVDFVKAHPCEE